MPSAFAITEADGFNRLLEDGPPDGIRVAIFVLFAAAFPLTSEGFLAGNAVDALSSATALVACGVLTTGMLEFDEALDLAPLDDPVPMFQTLRTMDLAEEKNPKRDAFPFPISRCR